MRKGGVSIAMSQVPVIAGRARHVGASRAFRVPALRAPQPARTRGDSATRFCSACGRVAAAKAWPKERWRQVIQQQLKTKKGNQVPTNQNGAARPCSTPQSTPAASALDGILQRRGISASIAASSRVSTAGATRTPPTKATHPAPRSGSSISLDGIPASSSSPIPRRTLAMAPANETTKARKDRCSRRSSGGASKAALNIRVMRFMRTSCPLRGSASAPREFELEARQVRGGRDLEVVLAPFHQQRSLAEPFEGHRLVGDFHALRRGRFQRAGQLQAAEQLRGE